MANIPQRPVNMPEIPNSFTQDNLILDLCVKKRKRPDSPDYTFTYPSPKHSPDHMNSPQTPYFSSKSPDSPEDFELSSTSDHLSPITKLNPPRQFLNDMGALVPLLGTQPLYYPSKSPPAPTNTSENAELSSTSDILSPITTVKLARPFKSFPKTVSSLVPIVPVPLRDSDIAYNEFRHRMLAQVTSNYSATNKNMRRNHTSQEMCSDPGYLEKRKKNNEAAKRSRDARKAKEDEIAIRCAFLEQENLKLKFRIAALESENQRLPIVYRR